MGVQFCLEVEGPFACFTRPEMKAERVSYDVITPSAARSIFEAIYWDPYVRWEVMRIDVLAPIRWINLRRNEVGSKIPTQVVLRAMRHSDTSLISKFIDEDRQQRAGLLLRDVRYRIVASLNSSDSAALTRAKSIFVRRACNGQCIYQPYFGCREFACDFKLVDPESAFLVPEELKGELDLGWMLRGMDFSDPTNPSPRFFRAKMRDGVLYVPSWEAGMSRS